MRNRNGIRIAGVGMALLAAVGAANPAHAQTCAPVQECGDVDASGAVGASDALKVLKKAVGQPQALSCSCEEAQPPPPTCQAGGIKVTFAPEAPVPVPADAAGLYDEAFNCVETEGGSVFNGIDSTHCYRKADDSSWRFWNSGCGWQIGRVEACDGWQYYAKTYDGSCGEVPPEQLDERALTTDVFYSNFGDPIEGVQSGPCTP